MSNGHAYQWTKSWTQSQCVLWAQWTWMDIFTTSATATTSAMSNGHIGQYSHLLWPFRLNLLKLNRVKLNQLTLKYQHRNKSSWSFNRSIVVKIAENNSLLSYFICRSSTAMPPFYERKNRKFQLTYPIFRSRLCHYSGKSPLVVYFLKSSLVPDFPGPMFSPVFRHSWVTAKNQDKKLAR